MMIVINLRNLKYIKTFLRAFNPTVGINTTSDILESTRGHFHLALYLERTQLGLGQGFDDDVDTSKSLSFREVLVINA